MEKKKITFKGWVGVFPNQKKYKLSSKKKKHLLPYPFYFLQQNILPPNKSLQTYYFSK